MKRVWGWFRRHFWSRPVTVAPVVDRAPLQVVSAVVLLVDDPFVPTLARSPFGYRYRRSAAYKDW